MLTKLDETLRHQTASTFDHAYTSDHRFFDRYWFGAYDPEGRMHVTLGLATYLNNNVMDGFVAIQKLKTGGGQEQQNFRVSRSLRPSHDDARVGPLSVDIVEPFKLLQLRYASDVLDLDLAWSDFLPPMEENHHFNRVDGREFQNYHRYAQVGRVDGTVTLQGKRLEIDNWWGGRDHSWGVRSQVGGFEPKTNSIGAEALAAFGYVFDWFIFRTDTLGGYIQLQCRGDGVKLFVDGIIGWPGTGQTIRVVDVDVAVTFHKGTHIYNRVVTRVKLQDGRELEIAGEPISGYWSMDGTGYDWGWNDRKGLGFYRGEYYSEEDVFDISHPADVIYPSGERGTPAHREAPVRITVTGDGTPQTGVGHQVLVVTGRSSWLGIE